MRKVYYISALIIVFLISIFITIKLSQKEKELVFTTIKKSYNYVSLIDQEEEIVFLIAFNQKDSFLTNKNVITSCYLTDEEENNTRQLLLEKIEYFRNINIKDETYNEYKYSFKFKIKANEEEEYILDEAYLLFNLVEEKAVKIKIGDFNYYKVNKIQDNKEIRISKIKGIVNNIEERKRVVALNIKIENESNEEVKINKIKIFNNNISINGQKSIICNFEINHNSNINEHITDYNYLEQSQNNVNFSINSKEDLNLLMPIVYKKNIVANSFGFQIDYTIKGKEEIYVFDDFLYFDNLNYEEQELKDLHFYYYEKN